MTMLPIGGAEPAVLVVAPVASNQSDTRVGPGGYLAATSSEFQCCAPIAATLCRPATETGANLQRRSSMLTASTTTAASMLLAIVVLAICPAVHSTGVEETDVDGSVAENRALSRLNLARLIGGGKGFAREAAWERPGCHKVGHTRKVSIPDCVEFTLSTNACRGYCESWSIPSSLETVAQNPHQPVTSVGQCCNMMDTEEIEVSVMCIDGVRSLKFKSALSCSCYHCKKD